MADNQTTKLSRRFWVSWWMTDASGAFELHAPWWISGERMDGAQSVCAAIVARDEDDARTVVRTSHDNPGADLEWRFVEERPTDWSAFSGRFRRAGWMKWEGADNVR
jgi:hypothetical protein